jgi:dipeptidyl aminopeptidase/acylaminoacyl peptidase
MKFTWRYWFRLFLFFTVSLTLAILALPYGLGVITVLGLLYAPCLGPELNPADYGYVAETVTLPARAGGEFRAYYLPGSNGATIIMPPTGSSGRGGRWAESLLLLQHGYGLFTYESRRCAGMGPLSLGYQEVAEVADALAYLQARPDIEPDQIGIYGFSSAGATAIMAAAQLPGLKAVVAEGGYSDFVENSLGPNSQSGYLERGFRWAFGPVYRLIVGESIEVLSPVSVIDQIAPRPILLIYGSREVSLPAGRQQLAAAGANAELWIVEGAGHGNYLIVARQAYETRLITFFNRALNVAKD